MSATKRNPELDGWRAFGVVGVMWLHWAPQKWIGWFPFELGLFFFLTLTGFLITRPLLQEASLHEGENHPWRWQAFGRFIKRRTSRILLPCYAAMVFAIMVGAPDIRSHAFLYFGHLSNFHMAFLERWPSGTAHYWTLAIQVQFYLLWPWVIWLTPKKLRFPVVGCVATVAIASRLVIDRWFPMIHHPEAMTLAALDYLAIGSLLAVLLGNGVDAGNRRLRAIAWAAFGIYVILYASNQTGHRFPIIWAIGQTCLALAMIGLIAASCEGITGVLGKILRSAPVQQVGKISYGLYLFHTSVPLFLGLTIPQLWDSRYPQLMLLLRLGAFSLVSWGLARLCWWYLEGGRKQSQALGRNSAS